MPTLPQLIEDDIRELNNALQALLLKSEAGVGLVIDKGGFIITRLGQTDGFDLMTLAALSAASYAATETIAGLVGEMNFSSVYQQGDSYSLLVMNVDANCLLVLVFRAAISVGAIKYYAVDTTKQIAKQLQVAQKRAPGEGLDLSMLNLADASEVFRAKKSA